ncbi:MAG: aminodeoxychorismate synthase component I [Candidatus Pelagadaptatus aseana]|uniref:aminodeoxychorismate synthase component I n=1 Tax=Candidatus Pelagadaptatus aseana TaxID=3120508 RepID=UPI0039B332C9
MTLRRVSICYQENSQVYFEAIRDLAWPVWLDSGKPRQSRGRFDFISAAPSTQVDSDALGPNEFWIQLQQALDLNKTTQDSDLPFCGGAIGYIGYDLGRFNQTQPKTIDADFDIPDALMGIYDWVLIQDHDRQQSVLVAQASVPEDVFSDLISRFTNPIPIKTTGNFELKGVQPQISEQRHLQSVEKIKDYILAGDCYQVNLAQRFDMNYQGDCYAAYLALREALPSQYSCYMETDNAVLLSLSPECFLSADRFGHITTKPIKGTLPRGETPAQDQQLAKTLLTSEKDRAENLMIVDLLRNDLSKICAPHSVQTQKLFELESYANVHHLVSTITGQKLADVSATDLLKACFPGGSITGAPKKRAMEIIEELEASRRSVYCGSIGYIGFDGALDMNIAIRTLIADDNKLYCWGGGGIVADSSPAGEYEESLNKIGILIETLKRKFSRVEL